MAEHLQQRLPAEPAAVPQLRHAARAYVERMAPGAELGHAVALAVTEAATNAVLHAFVEREPGTVSLVAEPADGQLVFCVRDDGRGLTPRIDSPGLGLGIPLLGRLCAQFDVRPGPDGSGTEVRMVFDAPQVRASRPVVLRERLEQALGSLADAVTVSDGHGRMVYANQVAAELLGARTPGEVVDATSVDLAARFRMTLPDGRRVVLADLPDQRLIAGEEHPEPLLTRSVHLASGRARWLLTQATALADAPAGERLAVNVIRDVTVATEAERRLRFMDEVGARLAAEPDPRESLQAVAAAAVPLLADWCAFDVLGADGVLERIALAHRDPAKRAAGEEVRLRFASDPAAARGPYAVVRTGRAAFVADLPDELLAAAVPDPEHLALLRSVGMRSVMLVPLTAHGGIVGVLTLVTADSARAFEPADLEFAQGLAHRAGLAIETARRLAGGSYK